MRLREVSGSIPDVSKSLFHNHLFLFLVESMSIVNVNALNFTESLGCFVENIKALND